MGSDPEFMIINLDGEYKSAIGILKATKEKKIKFSSGELFYDNVLMEMNVPPAESGESLINNISNLFQEVSRYIKPYSFIPQASQIFPLSECNHEDAFRFGCDPEYCVYALDQILPPTCEKGNTFRSAGGHIHLGQKTGRSPLNIKIKDEDRDAHEWGKIWVVRMLDLFVGIPSLFLDNDPTSAARRKLYGKPGSHRPKDYGVEYRATGNFWFKSPRFVELMFNLCSYTVEFCNDKRYESLWKSRDLEDCVGYDLKNLQSAINDSNKTLGKELMEGVIKKTLPNSLYNDICLLCGDVQYNLSKEWNLRR